MNLIEQVRDAGVVGAGGAGFPTHVKLNAKAEYLIVNAAECEPLLETDKFLMRQNADEMIAGVLLAKQQVQASKAVVALKAKYKTEIAVLEESIARLNADVEIFGMDNYYPAGDEQTMVYDVTGRTVPPAGIPLQVGCVVSNVGTLINVFRASQGKSVTRKIITVVGEVKQPRLIEAPLGMTLAECIEAAGGSKLEDYAVIRGGPMMGPILYKDQLAELTVTKADGGLIVLPRDHYLVLRSERTPQRILKETLSACIQCGFCTEQCPRFQIGHDLHPHKMMRVLGRVEEYTQEHQEALLCCACGICELTACPMDISPRQVNLIIADELRKKGIRYQAPETDKPITGREGRDFKKIPPERLIARIGLSPYYHQKLADYLPLYSQSVEISLSQHIGAPCQAVVAVGDQVTEGQMIGQVPAEKLGAPVHASISGRVTAIENGAVRISAEA
ncbi:4Fe-4S dicluster domain-containing protein [Pelagibaculum spongiae]|uniref:Proton-conducting membrane transporter n=1 Tax=Pelagibaculum spongiae TaxID=2080658 RepID=A0A2V1GRP4_9GAMM|nr:4Fe-4S dicluster domain-containing protein [Pelagibaculum spongiae]PVZ67758.1 proton-conducting membrane transporter [Pelagibaculum spongiae]